MSILPLGRLWTIVTPKPDIYAVSDSGVLNCLTPLAVGHFIDDLVKNITMLAVRLQVP